MHAFCISKLEKWLQIFLSFVCSINLKHNANSVLSCLKSFYSSHPAANIMMLRASSLYRGLPLLMFERANYKTTRIHGPSFVRARYCSVKIGLWTRHVQSLLRCPGYAE